MEISYYSIFDFNRDYVHKNDRLFSGLDLDSLNVIFNNSAKGFVERNDLEYEIDKSLLSQIKELIKQYLNKFEITYNGLNDIYSRYLELYKIKATCFKRADTVFDSYLLDGKKSISTTDEMIKVVSEYNTYKINNPMPTLNSIFIEIGNLLYYIIITERGVNEYIQDIIVKVNTITLNNPFKRHDIPRQKITLENPYGEDGAVYQGIYRPFTVDGCSGDVRDGSRNLCMNSKRCGTCLHTFHTVNVH